MNRSHKWNIPTENDQTEHHENAPKLCLDDASNKNCHGNKEENVFSISITDEVSSRNGKERTADLYDIKNEEVTDSDIHHLQNPVKKWIEKIDVTTKTFLYNQRGTISLGVKIVLALSYFAYFIYCMTYRFGDEGSIVMVVITSFFVTKVALGKLNTTSYAQTLWPRLEAYFSSKGALKIRGIVRYLLYFIATVGIMAYFSIYIFKDNPENLRSLIGILAMLFICLILSYSPSRVNWHPVFWGMIIQFFFAILTLRTEAGKDTFQWLGDRIQEFINYSDAGSFLVLGEGFKTMGLAFTITGIIIFFNSAIFVMIHFGMIDFVVMKLGRFLQFCLDTGPVESVTAASNIFIGGAEASMLVRPYLATVTRSELTAIMTCGFASISGAALGLFITIGAPANHLLTAAVISAPCALAISKVLYPELENVNFNTQANIETMDSEKKSNVMQAISEGAQSGVRIVIAIVVNFLALVSVVAFIDGLLNWFGNRGGIDGLSFKLICSYVLYPISYAMGIPIDDCRMVGSLIGIKLAATSPAGYAALGVLRYNRIVFENYTLNGNGTWHWSGDDIILDDTATVLEDGIMSVKAEAIATYAMCGFSDLCNIGICFGVLIPLCPNRKEDVLKLIYRAFLGGNIASFITGAVAGIMFTE